ncbi:MAG TPA: sterol desaturase family protein [Pseudohaliea sp.]|nr:sterol desaturase family protein [Pseudohaliea sp.]
MSDDLTLLAVPLYLAVVALEALWSRRHALPWYRARDTFVSLSMLLLAGVAEMLPKLVAVLIMIQLHELSPLRDMVDRQWWAWLLLFFLDDFSYYWFHRANHEVRLLWAGHVNHHSSRYLNFGTALRQGVGERLHKFLFWLWLPLLGFDAGMIITMISINLFYQFWVHTQAVKKLPRWFEFVFNTPSHHRVHHGSNTRYLDCNHGGVLIIWDRLFGTFSAESREEPVVYGLTRNIDGDSVLTVLGHEYAALWRDLRRASRWRDRLCYLFLAPGWSHDGEDRRARVLRRQAQSP